MAISRTQHTARTSWRSLGLVIVSCVLLCWPATTWAQSRGHLGVFIQNAGRGAEGGDKPSGEGVLILGLMRNGPAEQSGLKRGDIIVKLSGEPVRQVEDLQRLLGAAQLGESVEIEVLRSDERLAFPVTIAAAPASLPSGAPPPALPMLLQRDELLWVMIAAATFSLILVYWVSAQ